MKSKNILILLALVMFFQVSAFAAVNISQHTGTIKITNADGTVVTVGPNDPIPAIADGATIQVFNDGEVTIVTTDPSTVELIANGFPLHVPAGTTVHVLFKATGEAVFVVSNKELVEGYTPPPTPDTIAVDTSVQREELSSDISPVA